MCVCVCVCVWVCVCVCVCVCDTWLWSIDECVDESSKIYGGRVNVLGWDLWVNEDYTDLYLAKGIYRSAKPFFTAL